MIEQPARLVQPGPLEAFAILTAIPLGQFCHECCHWLFAKALRADPRLHLSIKKPMVVTYDAIPFIDFTVKLAPLYIGGSILVVTLLSVGFPPASAWTIAGALWWASMSWPSYEDREPFRTLEYPDTWNNDIIKATLGIYILTFLHSSPYGQNPFVQRYLILPLFIATMVLWGLGVWQVECQLESECDATPG